MKIKIISLMILLLFQVSCKETKEEEKTNKEVNIVYSNWSEGIAAAFLVKTILEENLEYKVNLTMAEIDEAYEGLSSGAHDLMLNAWLPQTHREYYEQYENGLSLAGIVYEDAETGLVVPEEAEIEKIQDIRGYTDTIYGIKSAAGIILQTRLAMEEYELGVNLKEQNEEKMLQILDEKYKRREPVVITGWRPHLMFSRYELKFLEDPKNIFPKSEKIYSVVNNNFSERDKVLMEFFSRFTLTQKQILSLIKEVKSNTLGEEAGAKQWIKDNRLLVSKWVRNLDEFEAKPM